MLILKKHYCGLLLGIALLASSVELSHASNPSASDWIDKFEAEEIEKLQSGELVTKTYLQSGQRWPKVEVYSYVQAPPKEAFAIFAHFEHQQNYIPNLESSKVVRVNAPTEVDVAYKIKLPWPISTSRYTHTHQVQKVGKKHYRMNWQMLESDTTEEVNGQVDFYPLDSEGQGYNSLLVYQNKVSPKSGFARFFRDAMVRDVERSLQATLDEIQRVWKNDTKLLKESVEILENSLKNINPFAVESETQ